MTDLNDAIPSLKRAVAAPGRFATSFPASTDPELLGYLGDAFGEAQIDGFFGDQAYDPGTGQVSPDLSGAGVAIVITYAAQRILTMRVMELRQRTAYEAGPTKYETENAASVMSEILKQMAARRKALLDQARAGALAKGGFHMVDAYADRLTGTEGLFVGAGEFFPYELTGI